MQKYIGNSWGKKEKKHMTVKPNKSNSKSYPSHLSFGDKAGEAAVDFAKRLRLGCPALKWPKCSLQYFTPFGQAACPSPHLTLTLALTIHVSTWQRNAPWLVQLSGSGGLNWLSAGTEQHQRSPEQLLPLVPASCFLGCIMSLHTCSSGEEWKLCS